MMNRMIAIFTKLIAMPRSMACYWLTMFHGVVIAMALARQGVRS